MNWDKLTTGPHQGKILPEAFFEDAGYVVEAIEVGELEGTLLYQAREVCRLAAMVRVPLDEDEEQDVTVFYRLLPDGRYGGHSVVSKRDPKLPRFKRFSKAQTDCFDLFMPMRIAPGDPEAPMAMVGVLKWLLLGDPHARLTRQQCEGFFDEPTNFVEG